MIRFDVRSDLDKAIKALNAQAKQVPFATALALTRTAADVQGEIRNEMPGNFTLRRDWVVKGIRIKPATKSTLTAEVFSRDAFMAIQESGGIKRSINRRVFDYKGYLAIPLDARRSKRDIVAKQDWPANLINPFVFTARDGRTYLAVHQVNVGKTGPRDVRALRGKQKRSTGLRLMYTLIREETLRPRLGMRRIATRVIEARFGQHFAAAYEQAVRTAR